MPIIMNSLGTQVTQFSQGQFMFGNRLKCVGYQNISLDHSTIPLLFIHDNLHTLAGHLGELWCIHT
jgi:hypothetical protein